MKLSKFLPTLALLALMSFSCSTDSIEEDKIDALANSYVPATKTIEIEILELINNHRITLGLNALNDMSQIKATAYSHTDYMRDKQEVSHDNFYQRSSSLKNNPGATKVGENVAYGFSSAQSVVNAWLNSDGHREIIEGDFTNFDVSAEKDQNGKWYYTNIFIKK
ncbi:CAP domain-containing protein [Pontimicrobium aquaticum]|uniref:CAP domain-containing protein n=1 Tax=Pontimicrobium aquaticum TaxID=2565367 RepID=A0A4U0EQR8_9FLAO|nr:CAP domain-containing protein [Pontimicrobium aquaticum]TJY34027.1 CAP domain-containing protein [Pontimicrobium aquaticum]